MCAVSTSDKTNDILVVDDDHRVIEFLEKILTAKNYRVHTATNGHEALESISRSRPDLILLDITLPEMDGFEVSTQLKANPETQEIPVIFVSGSSQIDYKERAFEAGAVDYLCKPFEISELCFRVSIHMSHAQDRKSLKSLMEDLEARVNERTAELAASRERLAMVLEGSQQGFWDWNIETGEVRRNEHWAKMLGYESIKEFEADVTTWTDNIYPDDRDAAWSAINDHLEGRSNAYKIEYRMLTKNGNIKWILDQAKIVKRDKNGRPLRMSGTHTDITERKLTETRNREQAKLLEMIYKHTHDCIVLLDREYNFIRVNEAYARACARDVSEFPGHNHFEFYPSDLIHSFNTVVETKEPFHIRARPFAFPDHPEWGTGYWDLSVIPILDKSMGVEFLLFTLKDVTGRTIAEQEREALQKQLQQAQKMESIGQLTGGIAHDFNNILATIMGFTELSLNKETTTRDVVLSQYQRQILNAAEKGRDLVSNMLAFGKAGSGELQPVNGELVVDDVVSLMRSTIPSSLNINVNFKKNVPPLLADPVQLHQVVTNLIINAYHAAGEHGSINLGITGPDNYEGVCDSCHQPFSGQFIEISVSDDGKGISRHTFEHMFEPFFSTKAINKGSGMGLSMVHGIMHACGGHILVQSEQGVGSQFRLLYQVASSKVKDSPAKDSQLSSVAVDKCIMVVDDEEAVLGFVAELLRISGYKVHAINNPLIALEKFRSEPESVDLVITDQTMPDMTGAELAGKLLSINSDLPIILCTGYSESINEESARLLGIAEYLNKPVSSVQLLNSIAHHVGEEARRLRRLQALGEVTV